MDQQTTNIDSPAGHRKEGHHLPPVALAIASSQLATHPRPLEKDAKDIIAQDKDHQRQETSHSDQR